VERKYQKTDVGVIIGRFQVPNLHEAHVDLIQTVCNEHKKVIIFLGLSPCKVTINNPLDFESRKQMLLEKFPEVIVLYAKDCVSDEIWSKNVDGQISDIVGPKQTVTLYGSRDSFIAHYKGRHNTQELVQERFVSGSEIRKEIGVKAKSSADFRAGVIWAVNNQYQKIMPTVDCAVFSEDGKKVLLARKPNESKYRFIGGFASDKGTYEDDAKREVMEEAGIEISEPEYVGSVVVDDWRYRKEQDKIKTLLFRAKYLFGSPKADDDVAEVRWFEFEKLTENDLVMEHGPLLKLLKN
jgi:bifunctional NMN adenylyltransferase/nudix hydrolase